MTETFAEIWRGEDPLQNTKVGLEKTFELLCARRGERGLASTTPALVRREIKRALMAAEVLLQSLLGEIQSQAGEGAEIDQFEAALIEIITNLEEQQRRF